MKTLFLLPLFLLLAFILSASAVFAHSGCCSHHDGVMSNGCGCNDGTPLSDTCSPYYTCNAPQQNTAPVSNYSSDITSNPSTVYVAPVVISTPVLISTPTPTIKPTATPKLVKKIVKKPAVKKYTKKKRIKQKPIPTLPKNWLQRLLGI